MAHIGEFQEAMISYQRLNRWSVMCFTYDSTICFEFIKFVSQQEIAVLILYIESKLGLHEVRVLSDEGTGFTHIAVVCFTFFAVFVVNICCDTLVYGHVLLWQIVVVFGNRCRNGAFPPRISLHAS